MADTPNDRGSSVSIRAKLIAIFITIKVLPLIFLAALLWVSLDKFDQFISEGVSQLTDEMTATIEQVGTQATEDAVEALDERSREAIERLTTDTAREVARFLYDRDSDVLRARLLPRYAQAYQDYIGQLNRSIVRHGEWRFDESTQQWQAADKSGGDRTLVSDTAPDSDEKHERFHKIPPTQVSFERSLPLYKEITLVDLNGKELIRVTTDSTDPTLRDVSLRENTYLGAETYFSELQALEVGQIYVSDVIGEYLRSPVIGTYTKARAESQGKPFLPEEAAYAGKENPVGRRFEGIVRWATPLEDKGEIVGYVTLALDHTHLMEFTDQIVPTDERYTEISDASTGNYAFMWDYLGRNISHPRDYFIVGYDAATGEPQVPWLEASLYEQWQAAETPINTFLEGVTTFDEQSLDKKPAVPLIKEGLLGLDCRYLNFAPQCEGWMRLTEDGGSGSFVIFWSGLWKLTTAATIPYYTGQYAENPRGFGFVTIGANINEFHQPALESQANLESIVSAQLESAELSEQWLLASAKSLFNNTLRDLTLSTLALTVAVVLIAVWMAAYITGQINRLSDGVARLTKGDLSHRLPVSSRDEFGKLREAINTMAERLNQAFEHNERAVEDLSEAKKMVELASDAGGIGFFSYCRPTDTLRAGTVFCSLYGIEQDSEQMRLSQIFEQLSEQSAALLEDAIARSAAEGVAVTVEHPLDTEEGVRWHRVTLIPDQDKQGRLVTGAVIDITDQNTQRRNLEAVITELNQRREEQQRMFSIIGHELRTPVSAIKMMLDDQGVRSLEPHGRAIVESTDSLISILDDLRVVVNPERMRAPELKSDTPQELVSRTLTSLQYVLDERGLIAHIQPNEEAQLRCRFDVQACRQLITNLIKNAAIHSKGTDIWVSVSVVPKNDRVAELSIRIEDNGQGISEDKAQRLFEAFSRGETEADGMGLGLHISQQLADRLQGALSYQRSTYGGAAFTLECLVELEANDTPIEKRPAETDPLLDLRILFVEDQRVIQMLSKKVLEKVGAKVTLAEQGVEALEKFDPDQIDLVITDLMMPEMDGYELTERLRAQGYEGLIIGVTAAVIGEETDRFIEKGGSFAIGKPMSLDEVRAILRANG